MNDAKYIGLDVHQATISAVALDSAAKVVSGPVQGPFMRRPASVKEVCVFGLFVQRFAFAKPPLSPPFHSHSL
jgi:hypothetical protein